MALDSLGFNVPIANANPLFPNAVRDAPLDATVPDMIEETRGLVETFLDLNKTFAQAAVDEAMLTIHDLRDATFPVALPDPPPAPNITTSLNATIGIAFDTPPDLGSITTETISPFSVGSVIIPDIEDEVPPYVPIITGLSIPDPPTYVAPDVPVAPGIDDDIAIPDAPPRDYGAPPDLMPITIPTYVAPVIPVFGDAAPEFTVLPPDPFLAWVEPAYTSSIKTAVEGVLTTLLAGGTGLPEAVERAIWERARVREDAAGRKTIDEAINGWATKGFAYPIGVLNAIVLAVQEETARKVNELSRERALKQADMEQENRRFAVQQALSYEQIFVGVFLAVVERNFQIAKFAVETQIQVYNLRIAAFNVQQQVYAQKIMKYRVDLDAAFALLKGFESQVAAEKLKTDVNKALTDIFDSKVKAYSSAVQGYSELIKGIVARSELQKNKVDLYRGQIEAMIGLINGQRARFEAYDSQIKGETARVGLEESNARVYAERVRGIGVKAEIVIKRADAQLASNRQTLEWNVANMQRVSQRGEMDLRVIQARLAAYQGGTGRAVAKYDADKGARVAEWQMSIELSRIAIAKYQALLEQWKTRSAEIIQFGQIAAESLRAAGQMATNLASGALAGTHVSAGISAGTSAGQQSSRSSSDNTSKNDNVNENSNYTILHQYNHRV